MKNIFVYIFLTMFCITASGASFGVQLPYSFNNASEINDDVSLTASSDCHHNEMNMSNTQVSVEIDAERSCCDHENLTYSNTNCCDGECGNCLNSVTFYAFTLGLSASFTVKAQASRFKQILQHIPDSPIKNVIIPPIY